MSKKALATDAQKSFLRLLLTTDKDFPVSFTFGGKIYRGFGEFTRLSRETKADPAGMRILSAYALGDLTVECDLLFNSEFGEAEYTLKFTNTGDAPLPVLRDVAMLDTEFPGAAPKLVGCMGDHENKYSAYTYDLSREDVYFREENGRATHIVFPYFNLRLDTAHGLLAAIGWAGTWSALFAQHNGAVRMKATSCVNLAAQLLPGESYTSALMVLLPYTAELDDDASNLWREWYIKYNMPRADAEGNPVKPFSTACFAGDTGLPNSDGSISEHDFTWKPTLDKLIAENMVPDFRWFDAGWYTDPAGNTVPSDWWGTIGSWKLDREKWPGDSFAQSNDACRAAGAKVLVWFEPERVTHLDDMVKYQGYKREWGIVHGNVITSNIGDPECLAWTLKRVTDFMDEHRVDLYREDNNSDPAFAWQWLDKDEAGKYGIERKGINENKCILGHYALWDGILAWCREHGRCTYLDSCASGGGRNDVASMRRGLPFMRSDYDRTTSALRLSMSATFNKWVPFHGAATKETVGQLDTSVGAGSDAYVTRASFLPVYNASEAFVHNPDLDYDLMRKNRDEWRSVADLLTKDFYTLTPWRSEYDRFGWTVFAYDDPEQGESVLLFFCMEDADWFGFTARPRFFDREATYTLTDADTGESVSRTGADILKNGIHAQVSGPKQSVMIWVKRN